MRYYLTLMYCILLCLTWFSRSQAQDNRQERSPAIIPPSPETGAFQRFGDVPVSPYNGLPDISIPLWKIETGDITFPIAISYHASGIRVAEEASRVGLGWALIAGGVISRSVLGGDDFSPTANSYHLSRSAPEIPKGVKGDRSHSFNIQSCNIKVGENDLAGSLSQGQNFQPDLYHFNFLGYSGKFFLNRSKEVILEKKEKISIKCLDENANAWQIRTPDGMEYLFEENELYVDNEHTTDGLPGRPKLAWYLTRIVSPRGFTVAFVYKRITGYVRTTGSFYEARNPVTLNSRLDQAGTLRPFEDVFKQVPGREYSCAYLSKIIFTGGEVRFLYSKEREDVENEVRLDSVQVHSNLSGLVNQWNMAYGYFSGSMDSDFEGASPSRRCKRLKLHSIAEKDAAGNVLPPYIFSYNNEKDNEEQLPSKTSFARDHWGYYNGRVSNTSLIPEYAVNEVSSIAAYYMGVMKENRDTDPVYAQLFSLKEIRYPTGGRTTFEYESHDFDIKNSEVNDRSFFAQYKEVVKKQIRKMYSGSIHSEQPSAEKLGEYLLDMNDLYVDRENPLTNNTSKVELEAFFRFDGSRQPVCLPSGSVYVSLLREDGTAISGPSDVAFFVGASTAPITICSGSISQGFRGASFKNTYHLTPGRYVWKLLLNGSGDLAFLKDVSLKVEYLADKQMRVIVNGGDSLTGADFAGGLRISRIIDKDGLTEGKAKVKRFNYHYVDGKGKIRSYGRRMNRPSYSYYDEKWYLSDNLVVPVSIEMHTQHLIRESDSNIPLNGSAGGSIVGYDQVNVLHGQHGEFGRTDYVFENNPDIILDYSEDDVVADKLVRIPRKMPVLGTISNHSNGNTLRQTDWRNENGMFIKVREITNDYSEFKAANSSLWYGVERRNTNIQNTSLPCSFKGFVYPTLAETRKLLTSTTVKTYDQKDTSLFLTQTEEYRYNQNTHLQVESISRNNSDESKETTYLTYPLDYSTVADASIKELSGSKHMHASIIEKKTVLTRDKEQKLLSGEITKYNLVNGRLHVGELAVLEIDRPIDPASVKEYKPSSGTYPAAYSTNIRFEKYDEKGNLLQMRSTDGILTTFLWGYDRRYPVAKILGAGYTEVMMAFNTLKGSNPDERYEDLQKVIDAAALRARLDEVRQHFASKMMVQVFSFTYAPLRGMQSETDANGRTTYYEYDGFGRLAILRDHEQNILKKVSYEYNIPVQKGTTACDTAADWKPTTTAARCKKANGFNTVEREQEQMDMNPCSVTYKRLRWKVTGTSTMSCLLEP